MNNPNSSSSSSSSSVMENSTKKGALALTTFLYPNNTARRVRRLNKNMYEGEILVKYANNSLVGPRDKTPLMAYVKQNDVEKVKDFLKDLPKDKVKKHEILEKEITHKSKDHGKATTALTMAIENQNFEIIKLLVDAGADVNYEDIYASTPLLWASKGDNLDIINYLLNNGADPNYNHLYGSPLLYAVLLSRNQNIMFDKVKLLVDAGAIISDEIINSVRNEETRKYLVEKQKNKKGGFTRKSKNKKSKKSKTRKNRFTQNDAIF